MPFFFLPGGGRSAACVCVCVYTPACSSSQYYSTCLKQGRSSVNTFPSCPPRPLPLPSSPPLGKGIKILLVMQLDASGVTEADFS